MQESNLILILAFFNTIKERLIDRYNDKKENFMSWRQVMIANKAHLSVKNSQLVVAKEESISIPLQDISAIMIEHEAVTMTASLLSRCADYKISVITCNQKKLPNGIWTGYHQHSRQLTVLSMQLSLSKPFRKRVWQQAIQQKIHNQSLCLRYLQLEGEKRITSYW